MKQGWLFIHDKELQDSTGWLDIRSFIEDLTEVDKSVRKIIEGAFDIWNHGGQEKAARMINYINFSRGIKEIIIDSEWVIDDLILNQIDDQLIRDFILFLGENELITQGLWRKIR